MMDTDAAPVPTETNSLADSGIISFPTDQTRKPLSEIEKIDVSRILESCQSFLKIRDDIKSNFGDF